MADLRDVGRPLAPKATLPVDRREEGVGLDLIGAAVPTDTALCVAAQAGDQVRGGRGEAGLVGNAQGGPPVDDLVEILTKKRFRKTGKLNRNLLYF